MIALFAAISALLIAQPASADDGWYQGFDENFSVNHRNTNIQVGVLEARSARATLIYLPGFADTIDNHNTLLQGFRNQGIHVVAFDYPEHGKSGGSIRWWGLKELAEIIPTVLADPRSGFNPSLPVILAGWSTGGTIALRINQAWRASALPQGTRLGGVIAFAPALPARIVINVDKASLTSGQMKRGPQPESVPLVGQFSASIMAQSKLAWLEGAPSDVPMLVLVADDTEDSYANSGSAVSWVKKKSSHVQGYQCAGAKHGLEFEPIAGPESRRIATEFAAALARGANGSSDVGGLRSCVKIQKQ